MGENTSSVVVANANPESHEDNGAGRNARRRRPRPRVRYVPPEDMSPWQEAALRAWEDSEP
jgi:hypothetical protein